MFKNIEDGKVYQVFPQTGCCKDEYVMYIRYKGKEWATWVTEDHVNKMIDLSKFRADSIRSNILKETAEGCINSYNRHLGHLQTAGESINYTTVLDDKLFDYLTTSEVK